MNSKDICMTAKSREEECELEALAFKHRLRFFRRTNWTTIILPVVLSTFAGAGLIADTVLGVDWKIWTGSAALLSALLVAIHRALDCDAHQAECRRLMQAYFGLATRYRTIHQLELDDSIEKLVALEANLATLRETTTVDIPDAYKVQQGAT